MLVVRVTNKVKCLIVITKHSIISAVELCPVKINKDLITTWLLGNFIIHT